MKIGKMFLSALVALLLVPVVSGMADETEKDIKLDESSVGFHGRTSVPSVNATQYSDYILLDINQYYGNVVVEVENEETGESISSQYFVNSRDTFTFDISQLPEGTYYIRIRFENGMEYTGLFSIEIE